MRLGRSTLRIAAAGEHPSVRAASIRVKSNRVSAEYSVRTVYGIVTTTCAMSRLHHTSRSPAYRKLCRRAMPRTRPGSIRGDVRNAAMASRPANRPRARAMAASPPSAIENKVAIAAI